MLEGNVEAPKSRVRATTLCYKLLEVGAVVVPMSLFPGMVCSQLEEAAPRLSFLGMVCFLRAVVVSRMSFPGKECSPGAEEESTKMSHMA